MSSGEIVGVKVRQATAGSRILPRKVCCRCQVFSGPDTEAAAVSRTSAVEDTLGLERSGGFPSKRLLRFTAAGLLRRCSSAAAAERPVSSVSQQAKPCN